CFVQSNRSFLGFFQLVSIIQQNSTLCSLLSPQYLQIFVQIFSLHFLLLFVSEGSEEVSPHLIGRYDLLLADCLSFFLKKPSRFLASYSIFDSIRAVFLPALFLQLAFPLI
uniref:Ovule protein n=1 Tax=Parascaris univalens TaxID=6257 RepID=A0A915C9C4_PARUN